MKLEMNSKTATEAITYMELNNILLCNWIFEEILD